jgi:hypothetical protein
MRSQRFRPRRKASRVAAGRFGEIEAAAIDDELALSLVETFPASDPPAWIPLTRIGVPSRQPKSRPAKKHH